MDENMMAVQNVQDDSIEGQLLARKTSFSSLKANTVEDKMRLFNAINTPDERLKSFVNKTIFMKDLYCETVTLQKTNPDGTIEYNDCPRIVIVDNEGTSYACVSSGVFSSLKKIISLFGVPTWETPIPITPITIDKGDRSVLSITLDENAFPKKSKK